MKLSFRRASALVLAGTALTSVDMPARAAAVPAVQTASVLAAGSNTKGELGAGSSQNRLTSAAAVVGLTDVVQVAASYDFGDGNGGTSFALRADGTVWAWGNASQGALGDGTSGDPSCTCRALPVQVAGVGGSGHLSDVVAIAARELGGVALRSDGSIVSWGENGAGQVGDGTTTARTTPVQVLAPGSSVVEISALYQHNVARKSDGSVLAWGSDIFGEIGSGTRSTDPCKCRPIPTAVVGTSGTGQLTGVVAVAAGSTHSMALMSDSTVTAWGDQFRGSLGDGVSATNIFQSQTDACNNGGNKCRAVPASVLAVGGSGSLSGASRITAGPQTSFAFETDGSVVAWGSAGGSSSDYSLGDGSHGDSHCLCYDTPHAISSLSGKNVVSIVSANHVGYALRSDNTVLGWGDGFYGEFADGTTGVRMLPSPLTTLRGVTMIASEYGHVLFGVGRRRGGVETAVADFAGDGSTPTSVFRPDGGGWFATQSGGNVATSYGARGDVPVPADYDGDGKADIAIFRPSTGLWAIHLSTGGDAFLTYGGVGGDVPVPADYDGDGKADVAVFRSSVASWYIHYAAGGDSALTFGLSGDVPVPADYDGDGKADIAVFRASSAAWYVHGTLGTDSALGYGTNGDVPVVADYDGDTRADIAIYRPSTGLWSLHLPHGDVAATYGGIGGDVPVAADYDGDAKVDVAIFRPAVGGWYVRRSIDGIETATTFGLPSDIPLPISSTARQMVP